MCLCQTDGRRRGEGSGGAAGLDEVMVVWKHLDEVLQLLLVAGLQHNKHKQTNNSLYGGSSLHTKCTKQTN